MRVSTPKTDYRDFVCFAGDWKVCDGPYTVVSCPSGMLVVLNRADKHGEPMFDPKTGKEVFYPAHAEW